MLVQVRDDAKSVEEKLGWSCEHKPQQSSTLPGLNQLLVTNFLFIFFFCGGVWAARGACEVGLEGEMLLFWQSFVSLSLGSQAG